MNKEIINFRKDLEKDLTQHRFEHSLGVEYTSACLAIVHGAICGWDLQVMLVPAGSGRLHQLYPEGASPSSKTSLPFTPAACAALQAAIAVRYLCGHTADTDRELHVGSLRDLSLDSVPFED